MDDKRLKALVVITLCAVAESGEAGAISGHLYAALMAQGVTLYQHETIVRVLVNAGWATKSGHVLHATEKGRALAGRVEAVLK